MKKLLFAGAFLLASFVAVNSANAQKPHFVTDAPFEARILNNHSIEFTGTIAGLGNKDKYVTIDIWPTVNGSISCTNPGGHTFNYDGTYSSSAFNEPVSMTYAVGRNGKVVLTNQVLNTTSHPLFKGWLVQYFKYNDSNPSSFGSNGWSCDGDLNVDYPMTFIKVRGSGVTVRK